MSKDEKITLESLGQGAAVELFGAELQRVLENITDPNTPATAVRSVTLKVTIKPTDDRCMGITDIACKAVLAPNKAFKTRLFIGTDRNGTTVALEHNPKQAELDLKEGEKKAPLGIVAGGSKA